MSHTPLRSCTYLLWPDASNGRSALWVAWSQRLVFKRYFYSKILCFSPPIYSKRNYLTMNEDRWRSPVESKSFAVVMDNCRKPGTQLGRIGVCCGLIFGPFIVRHFVLVVWGTVEQSTVQWCTGWRICLKIFHRFDGVLRGRSVGDNGEFGNLVRSVL